MKGPAFEIDIGPDDKPLHRVPRRFADMDELKAVLPAIISLNADTEKLTIVIRSVE